jgi:hypothetical protein
MRRPAWTFVIAALLAPAAAAQDDPKAVLDKAVQAVGGPAAVAKMRAARLKAEGTAAVVPGQPALPVTVEDVWLMPDKYRTTATFTVMGKQLTQTQVLDGKTGWIKVGDQVQDMPKDALAEMTEQKYAEDLDRLGFVGEKGFDLSAAPEVRVNDRPAAGVLVKSRGRRDVTLYFDTETGLLVKRVQTVLDPTAGKQVSQEVTFADYKETAGVKYPRTLTLSRAGRKLIEVKVTELEFLDKPDPKLFARP